MENALLMYSNPIPGHRQTTSLSFDSSYSHQQCQQSKYNPLHLSSSVEMALAFTTSKGELSFTGVYTRLSSVLINQLTVQYSSVQSLSQVQLCEPMDCSMPGLPAHHQLPEFTQTHVHWVSDAIQPSHPLSSPSSPTLNLSQHQGLCKWVSS